jgi:hypothetical protein
VNLAAETRYGQDDAVYKEHVLDLAINVGRNVEEHKPLKFIQVSTAQVYDSDKKPSKEAGKLKPWTKLAQFHKQAEDELKAMKLPLVIVRPAQVYGPCDRVGLTPRFICAAVYKHLKQKMTFMWAADLKMNTVHVRDVCGAIWHLLQQGKPGDIFNLADKTDTDQGKISDFLGILFRIETGFVGSAMSTMASVSLKSTVEAVNEKHCQPWSEMCRVCRFSDCVDIDCCILVLFVFCIVVMLYGCVWLCAGGGDHEHAAVAVPGPGAAAEHAAVCGRVED